MADLSAVLRKTIDGLPRATPQLRAKVYDKARAAILRQIESANPPLEADVVEARMAALDEAIDRTEAHYLTMDQAEAPAAGAAGDGTADPERREASPVSAERAPRPEAPAMPPAAFPAMRDAGEGNGARGERKPLEKPDGGPKAPGRLDKPAAPVFPAQAAEPDDAPKPASVGAPFVVPGAGSHPDAPAQDEEASRDLHPSTDDRGADPFGHDGIPEADLAGPRYAAPRKGRRLPYRSIAAGLAVILLLGGAGALGWTYRDQLEALLVNPAGFGAGPVATTTGEDAGTVEPATPAADDSTDAPTDVAALPQATDEPEPAADAAPADGPAPAATDAPAETPAPAAESTSTRRFTQRLLPDGTEVDEGPGEGNANAFNEGTNIAAASPVAEEEVAAGLVPEASTTVASEIGENIAPVGADTPAAAPGAAAGEAGEEVAAVQPDTADGAVPVAQTAVFYEERSETEPGTQQSGNVVWSVVNEPPAEGQPAEPAIRAVADVPEENLKMTMTIRRNADPTLPASHVIELLFDVPPNFDGGEVANVQRLALKPTEQARGEPLIGVAGKISDGFFVIALNNLDQAVQSNLALMSTEEWIDIPLAYATGRRALMSIEKGIPGERAFKEAMDAWAENASASNAAEEEPAEEPAE